MALVDDDSSGEPPPSPSLESSSPELEDIALEAEESEERERFPLL